MKSIFKCIDAHTCGNPVRVVVEGHPKLEGHNMSEKRQHFIREFDWIRRGLMFEPRGHDMMSGSFIYPPHNPENDFSILYIETSGCLPICGHGTIGTVTIAIEENLVTPKTPGILKIETPGGLITVEYNYEDGKVNWVKLTNVASYLALDGLVIESPDLGELIIDVAYGGNFYAIVDRQDNFSGIQDYSAAEIIKYSQVLRQSINEKFPNKFIHPENETIRNVSHILWTGTPIDSSSTARNAVFYGDKAIDRSPCGTGTSARMAQLYHKGVLKKGDEFIHESYIGSKFTGKIEDEVLVGSYQGIIPSVKGWAKIYGYNSIIIDDDDPYALGFSVI